MHRIPRFVISFEKDDDPEYPVLPLTGTLRQIEEDLAFFLTRHPELSRENFVPYRSARIA